MLDLRSSASMRLMKSSARNVIIDFLLHELLKNSPQGMTHILSIVHRLVEYGSVGYR